MSNGLILFLGFFLSQVFCLFCVINDANVAFDVRNIKSNKGSASNVGIYLILLCVLFFEFQSFTFIFQRCFESNFDYVNVTQQLSAVITYIQSTLFTRHFQWPRHIYYIIKTMVCVFYVLNILYPLHFRLFHLPQMSTTMEEQHQ